MSKQIRDLSTATVISVNDWLVLETPAGGTYKVSTATFLNKLDTTSIIAGNNIKTSINGTNVTISGVGIWYVASFNSTVPTVLASGKRYYNITSNKIFTSNGTAWDTGFTPFEDALYVNLVEKVFYFYNGTTLIPALTRVKTDNVFTVNYANINSLDNTPDLLKINTSSQGTLQFKVGSGFVPLSATTPAGDKFVLATIDNFDASALADGTYNVFVNSAGVVSLLKNTLYTQSTIPTSPVSGDYWLNTVISPYSLVTYSGTAWATAPTVIPLGTATVASGIITAVTTFKYNKKYV